MSTCSEAPPKEIAAKARIAGWLLGLARRQLPQRRIVGAEIGVKQGLLSAELLSRDIGLTLWMVDHWKKSPDGYDYVLSGDPAANATDDEIAQWYLDAHHRTDLYAYRRRVVRMDSVRAARTVAAGTFDFVFIDADHSFGARLADIRAWWPLLRSGGLLAGGLWTSAFGGDCCERAVQQFIDEKRLDVEIVHGPAKTWGFIKP